MFSKRRSKQTPAADEDFLSNWMSNLPDEKKIIPLSQLAIPGTHDSFTNSLTKKLPIAPDRPEWMIRVGKIFNRLTKTIIYRWAKCQRSNCRQQLMQGCRYFDIRLAKCEENQNQKESNGNKSAESLRVIHGLFGDEIISILSDLNAFLDEHLGEVVILDFQHIFDFIKEDHQYLLSLIKATFGVGKLCPVLKNETMFSLKEMLANGHRVIIVYPSFAGIEDFWWPRQLCPNPWPNTMRIDILTEHLNQGLQYRDPRLMFVSQGVLTPQVSTVLLHPFSTLEKAASTPCNRFLEKWIDSEDVRTKSPNIIMCDFPEMYDISKKIVNLNLNN